MKKLVIASLLIAGLATSGLVWAHGNGGYGMRGHSGMMGNGGYGMMDHGSMMMGHGSMMGHHGMMLDGAGAYNCPGAVGFNGDGFDNAKQQKFLDETAALRKQIHEKRFDYMEAQRNPDTTGEQLGALEKEIYDLQIQLRDKAQQY